MDDGEGWDYHLYLGLKKVADIKADGTVEYYLTDHLGTVNACLDKDGNVTQRYTFGPYGNLEYAEGTSDNRYLFQGKELDLESGDYYFGARYYDAEAGRWLGRDPKEQFFSSYNAFGNNPMMYVDPDGKYIIQGALAVGWWMAYTPSGQTVARQVFIYGSAATAFVNSRNGKIALGAATGFIDGVIDSPDGTDHLSQFCDPLLETEGGQTAFVVSNSVKTFKKYVPKVVEKGVDAVKKPKETAEKVVKSLNKIDRGQKRSSDFKAVDKVKVVSKVEAQLIKETKSKNMIKFDPNKKPVINNNN